MFHLLKVSDNPPIQPDCFIILSYAVEDSNFPTTPTKKLIIRAYSWWKRFPESYIIMSTGDNQGLGVSNAHIMKEYGISIGIPPEKILVEDTSVNTYQNLKYSWIIVRKIQSKHATLIAYDLHMKRALAIARKSGLTVPYWMSVSSPGSPAYGWKRFQTYSRLTIFLYELGAYIYNRIRGEI